MKQALSVAKAVVKRLKRHNMMVSAAGIAFYGLLAMVPTLIALVSIYGLISNPDDIKQQLEDAASSLDPTTKDFVEQQLVGITTSKGTGTALLIGIVLALFSASGALQKLMVTIQVAYESTDTRPGWLTRAVAYALTLGAIVGVSVIGFILGVVPVLLDQANLGTGVEAAIGLLRLPLLGILFGGGLTMLYRYSGDRHLRTSWRNWGAVIGTITWVVFAIGFSLYASQVGAMPASYGLLGTVAALMIFLQLTTLAIVIGAEVNAELEARAAAANPSISAGSNRAVASQTGIAPVGLSAIDTTGAPQTGRPEPVSFAKAAAGLALLFVLGRGKE